MFFFKLDIKKNLIILFVSLIGSFGEKVGYEIANRKIKNKVLALNKIRQ